MCRTAHALLSVLICGIQMLVRVFMTFILMMENVFRLILQTLYNLLAFLLQMLSLIPICLVFLATTRLKCFMCGGGGPCPVNRGGGCDCLMSLAAVILLFFIFRAVGVLDKIFYKIGYVQVPTEPPGSESGGSRPRFFHASPAPGDVTECSRDATEGDATQCARLTTVTTTPFETTVTYTESDGGTGPFSFEETFTPPVTGTISNEWLFRFRASGPTTEIYDTEIFIMTETETEAAVSDPDTYESDPKNRRSIVKLDEKSTSFPEIEGAQADRGVDSFSSPIPATSSAATLENIKTHTEIYFKDPDAAMETETLKFIPIKARRQIKPNILVAKITKALELDSSLAKTASFTKEPQINTIGTANPKLELKSEKATHVLLDALDYFNKPVTTAMHYVA